MFALSDIVTPVRWSTMAGTVRLFVRRATTLRSEWSGSTNRDS